MKGSASVFGILTITTVLFAACANTVRGESVIYTFDPKFVPSQWDMGANSEITGFESVPQFNPALGVLDSVDISFGSAYGSMITVSGPDGASGNLNLLEQTTFQDAGNNIDVTIGNEWTCNFSLPSYTSAGSSSPGTESFSYNSPAVLSEFTGTGNFSLQVTGAQHADTTFAPPGITANITEGNFGADACVTYIYTVPEPGCASLLVIGFGLMLVRRKAGKRLM